MVPFETIAHIIINVGSFPVLIASALLASFGWRKIRANGWPSAGSARRWAMARRTLHDPLKFGSCGR